ncbi:unnamed protein product [Camellia sinensis]
MMRQKGTMALHTVQVRSVEDGFRGSWHSGTVIACENQARRVQYDHLLCDDGLQPLIDCIKVPPVIDGIVPAIRVMCNHRGLIRPLPPPIDFTKWSFHYGQCVDVYYNAKLYSDEYSFENDNFLFLIQFWIVEV